MRSLTLQLPDPVYAEAQRTAEAQGYSDMSAYVADLIAQETESFDYLFTPERLAIIDRADAEVNAGNFLTLEEAKARLAATKEAWLKANPR